MATERHSFVMSSNITRDTRLKYKSRKNADLDPSPPSPASIGTRWEINRWGEAVFSLTLPRFKNVTLTWKIRAQNASYEIVVNRIQGWNHKHSDKGQLDTPYTEYSASIPRVMKPGVNEIKFIPYDATLAIHELIVDIEHLADKPDSTVSVDAIEVTQSIQNMDHTVPLIYGKTGYARVYLTLPAALAVQGAKLSGEIQVKNTGTGEITYVYSENVLDATKANQADLLAKRNSAANSLNFRLPDECVTGNYEISLNECYWETGGPAERLAVAAHSKRIAHIAEKAPPLRLRVVGLRYTDSKGQRAQPRSVDYDLITSWLKRAFPIASVQFSRTVTDAQHSLNLPLGEKVDEAIVQVAAMRNLDMAYSNIDKRTHYYGLVLDEQLWINQQEKKENKTFMRGKAETLPSAADPTTVAAGPAGTPYGTIEGTKQSYGGWPWDTDDSYGDWYTAHELGHTFGRKHVNATGNEIGVDSDYPYAGGTIGDAAHPNVGFDAGDSGFKIPAQALPFSAWRDVMSYGENEWLSDYTYKAILARLREEDKLGPSGAGNGCSVKYEKGKFINIIAAKNTHGMGGTDQESDVYGEGDASSGDGASAASSPGGYRFEYINPVPGGFVPVSTPAGDAIIRVYFLTYGSNATQDYPVRKRGDFIDTLIKIPNYFGGSTVAKIEYLEGKVVKATYDVPGNARSIDSVTVPATATAGVKTVTWTSTGGSPLFNVQVNRGDARIGWETLAVGLTEPRLDIVTDEFGDLSKTLIRIMATNGTEAVFSKTYPLGPEVVAPPAPR